MLTVRVEEGSFNVGVHAPLRATAEVWHSSANGSLTTLQRFHARCWCWRSAFGLAPSIALVSRMCCRVQTVLLAADTLIRPTTPFRIPKPQSLASLLPAARCRRRPGNLPRACPNFAGNYAPSPKTGRRERVRSTVRKLASHFAEAAPELTLSRNLSPQQTAARRRRMMMRKHVISPSAHAQPKKRAGVADPSPIGWESHALRTLWDHGWRRELDRCAFAYRAH